MHLYMWYSVLYTWQFWQWLELNETQQSKTVEKRAFLNLLCLLDGLVCTIKSFKNVKLFSYMTTHIRRLNTKFFDLPTDLAQLIVFGFRQSIDFGDFSAKESFCLVIKWRHTFSQVSSFYQAQLCQVWCRSKKVLLTSKIIFIDRFPKASQLSKCPRTPTWQHCLISVIWPQEKYLIT